LRAQHTTFDASQMAGASIEGTDFHYSSFRRADLDGASFDTATQLDCVDFGEANYERVASWPCNAFNPLMTGTTTSSGGCTNDACGYHGRFQDGAVMCEVEARAPTPPPLPPPTHARLAC